LLHDSELRYIADLILAEKLDAVPYIDVHHPSITRRLRVSSHMQIALRKSAMFLYANPPSTPALGVAAYLSWSGLVFIEIGRHGYADALPYIQADLAQFIEWKFDENLCKKLALLQGVVL